MTQPRLSSSAPPLLLTKSLVLIGMMGAGKTSLGRRLATALDLPFYDSDDEVEAAAGCSVADIFATQGEAAFRDAEHLIIKRLLSAPRPTIISTGGGAFIQPRNHELIQRQGLSLWLDAPVEVLLKRTAKRNTRPLLRQGNPEETLTRLLQERGPVYQTAHLRCDSSHGTLDQLTTRIISQIRTYLETQA